MIISKRWTATVRVLMLLLALGSGGNWLVPKAISFVNRWQLANQVAASRPAGLSVGDPVWTCRVVNVFPHDRKASTQGLVFHGQRLLESTGGHSSSRFRVVDFETGHSPVDHFLESELYGEGLAVMGDRAFQLTWEQQVCLVWDLSKMSIDSQLDFPGDGWGATAIDGFLVTSDGSETLTWRDPKTMVPVRQVQVTSRDGTPVASLNELEVWKSEILANIFMTNYIARIDPASGKVLGWIDCNNLLGPIDRARAGVLNGIAYNAAEDRLFVTGKTWPKLFEVEFVEDLRE